MGGSSAQVELPAEAGVDQGRRVAPAGVLWGIVAGLIWAVLAALALPPTSLWFTGFLAPLPICLLGWLTRLPLRAAAGVAIGSVLFWAFHHAWIADVSLAGVFPLVVYLALFSGLTVVVLNRVRRVSIRVGPALAIPTAWVGLEFARGELILEGYPWFMAAHPMIESVVVSRAATLGGVYLVSWLVVSLSGIVVARLAGDRTARRVGIGVSALILILLACAAVFPPVSSTGEMLRLGALQTDVPQDNKVFPSQEQLVSDFQALADLIDEGTALGAELLVTPETVLPGGLLDPAARRVVDEPFGGALLEAQRASGVPMLAGCTTLDGLRPEDGRLSWDDTFNSVFLIVDGEVVGPRYDKLRPTPFGETLPYVQSFPWLRDTILRIGLGASGMDFGLTPGSTPVTFVVPTRQGEVAVSAPICFESSMAPTVRRIVNASHAAGRPAELLCVMTNDGWFGTFDVGREMHVLQARWRCVEHGMPMIRSANTGVSALIDRHGKIIESLDARSAGVLVGEIRLGDGRRTLYQTFGELVGWLCVVATFVAFVLSFRIGRKQRTGVPEA